MTKETETALSVFARGIKDIIGKDLVKIILYGSCARGEDHDGSDVDIMVLTNLSGQELEEAECRIFDLSYDIFMEYNVDISVVVKNEEHFRYWLGVLPFYDNIQREGIVVNG